jgi:hypothetical protein
MAGERGRATSTDGHPHAQVYPHWRKKRISSVAGPGHGVSHRPRLRSRLPALRMLGSASVGGAGTGVAGARSLESSAAASGQSCTGAPSAIAFRRYTSFVFGPRKRSSASRGPRRQSSVTPSTDGEVGGGAARRREARRGEGACGEEKCGSHGWRGIGGTPRM